MRFNNIKNDIKKRVCAVAFALSVITTLPSCNANQNSKPSPSGDIKNNQSSNITFDEKDVASTIINSDGTTTKIIVNSDGTKTSITVNSNGSISTTSSAINNSGIKTSNTPSSTNSVTSNNTPSSKNTDSSAVISSNVVSQVPTIDDALNPNYINNFNGNINNGIYMSYVTSPKKPPFLNGKLGSYDVYIGKINNRFYVHDRENLVIYTIEDVSGKKEIIEKFDFGVVCCVVVGDKIFANTSDKFVVANTTTKIPTILVTDKYAISLCTDGRYVYYVDTKTGNLCRFSVNATASNIAIEVIGSGVTSNGVGVQLNISDETITTYKGKTKVGNPYPIPQ